MEGYKQVTLNKYDVMMVLKRFVETSEARTRMYVRRAGEAKGGFEQDRALDYDQEANTERAITNALLEVAGAVAKL